MILPSCTQWELDTKILLLLRTTGLGLIKDNVKYLTLTQIAFC